MSSIAWARLMVAADQVDDLEAIRKATANRLRSLTQPTEIPSAGIVIDKAGEGTPEAIALESQLEVLQMAEKTAVLELNRAMRAHPLSGWVKESMGVGTKSVARLLGAIGDPCRRYDPEAEELVERKVSQLWSYCGYGDAETQKRRKGVKSNWNSEAKMRVHIIAEAAFKPRCETCVEHSKEIEAEGWSSPPADCTCEADGYQYRVAYEQSRAADTGLDLSDLHKHNRALRKVKKLFLLNLWLEARRVQDSAETHQIIGPSRIAKEVAA